VVNERAAHRTDDSDHFRHVGPSPGRSKIEPVGSSGWSICASCSCSSRRAKASIRLQPIGRRTKTENSRRSPSPMVLDGLSTQPNLRTAAMVPFAPLARRLLNVRVGQVWEPITAYAVLKRIPSVLRTKQRQFHDAPYNDFVRCDGFVVILRSGHFCARAAYAYASKRAYPASWVTTTTATKPESPTACFRRRFCTPVPLK
jgi:hypothetical protein